MRTADQSVQPDEPLPSPLPASNSSSGLIVALSLALAALVFGAFQPAFDNGFVGYDDPDYVTSNVVVQRGLNSEGIKWALTSTEAANWHPLTWLSHMLDVQLFALNPAGHHLTSILLHTISSVLLFLTLRTLTGATWRSFIVAALFGLHPLRVESVAWVAERKDALSAVFWFLTILTYAQYVRAAGTNKTRAKTFYTLTLLCFVCGLMAKPMLVTLPFALLLLDFWPLKRFDQMKFSKLVLEKLPFITLSGASCVITFLVQRSGGAVNEHLSLGYRLSNVVISFVRYLGKIFWPTDLTFFYPHPQHWPTAAVAAAVLLLLFISALAVRMRRRHPSLFIGWCWFFGTLVPVIGLVQVGQQAIADRYSYIPSVGILIALVWTLHSFVKDRKQLAQVFGMVSVGAAMGCFLATRQQTRVWKNTESLCRHAISVAPKNYLAHDLLGDTLFKNGQLDEGLREQLRSVEIRPSYAEGFNNLAVNLQHQGNLTKAVECYQRAIELRPRYPEAHFNLALALESTGQFENALAEYSRAIAQRRNYTDAHYNLGLLYGRLGRLDQAIIEFQTTLAINPYLADAHNNLGVIFDRLSRFDEAIRHYQQAVTLQPVDPRAHFNLGVALGKAGRLEAAASEFETALRLKPDHAEAQANLTATRAAMSSSTTLKP